MNKVIAVKHYYQKLGKCEVPQFFWYKQMTNDCAPCFSIIYFVLTSSYI